MTLVAPVPALPDFTGEPVLARVAGAAHSFLAGRRVRVACHESAPLGPVLLDGVAAAGSIATGGVVERVRWSAAGLERRVRVPDGGLLLERVFVPATAEFAAFEWSGAAADVRITGVDDAATTLCAFPTGALVSGHGSALVRVDDGARVLLLVAPPGAPAPDMVRRLPALVRARAAAASAAAQQGLLLTAAAPALGAAMAWARQALAGADAGSQLDVLLAALALGNAAPAADALLAGAPRLSDDAAAALAASYVAWTGEPAPARAVWPRARAAPAGSDPLIALAEALGDDDAAARLRSLRPVALAGRTPAQAIELPAAQALPFCAEGDAARFVLHAVRELLGAEPDAPRARLRLAPRMSAALHALSAERIRMGDAAVTLRCRHAGGEWRFDVEQVEGAAPVRLILEPTLPPARAPDQLAFEVDGMAAGLVGRAVPGGVAFAVQLMLDAPRRVLVRGRA
jgi:hypothetical protein